MAIKIGIPRALWFFDYYPLWKTFYEELGAEVILSDPTNKETLDLGVKNTVDEACLPVKIFHGHVLNLKDRVDVIFIPKVMSVYENEYICPKFCGLPEMVNHSIPGLPQIIDTEINFNRSRKSLKWTIYQFGRVITKNPIKIWNAYKKALEVYNQYREKIMDGNFPLDGEINEVLTQKNIKQKKNIKVALLGHSYNIFDSYGSMNLIQKLLDQHIEVIVPEMMDFEEINHNVGQLEKKMFWSFGRKILGTAMHIAEKNEVDGVIYLSSFGCGIDSIIEDLSERKTRKSAEIPYLLITVDEHTGEAGVNTRLEAFLDMIEWRKRDENNLSAHG
ncbi:acyl-CoA dehydratase activase-related protein [Serpentinicella sp. ANB-PHB4]|uniref:acyl-CoA dehydratase activase-related protein n=1 Tax=Serpentinicella sp. ANB-PHB4 TaxID=3074076 RepID=UPI0028559D30|nr:acyl-CoA dehydratase activase-related protein [Serpentinicella sp. ANB-PHB4]MDR5658675.1 acyl-CoA dehydratase activase-related protein [Serpentinicella sp. ANB-PHB4]